MSTQGKGAPYHSLIVIESLEEQLYEARKCFSVFGC